jgi:hypothetical protein
LIYVYNVERVIGKFEIHKKDLASRPAILCLVCLKRKKSQATDRLQAQLAVVSKIA